MVIRKILGAALLAAPIQASLAGPQYVDESGYAVGGYDVVAYHDLEQSPFGESQPEAIPGSTSITAEYNGATWAFASEEHRAAFLADPKKYAPAFDDHCAYGVAKGGKVPANPNLWRIVDGELYLNITPNVAGFFGQDVQENISSADRNWPSLESAAASTKSWRAIPDNTDTYSTRAPVDN